MEPTVPSGGNPLKMKKDGSGACEYMNRGPVVVTLHCEAWYRDFAQDKATKKMAIRLVTFGAPRYALSTKFFPSPRNFYVYTVENLYRSGNNWRTDPKVFEWEKGLREGSWAYRKADTKRPKDSRKRVWTAKCQSSATGKGGAHAAQEYYRVATSGRC
ncbi:MAG: hypothetical protein ABJN26_15200 [Stappiaceae bacterium]